MAGPGGPARPRQRDGRRPRLARRRAPRSASRGSVELLGIDTDPPRRRLQARRVPPRVAARPRPHPRPGHPLQPPRHRPPLGVGAVQPGQPADGQGRSPRRRRSPRSARSPSAGHWSRSSCAAASRCTGGRGERRLARTSRPPSPRPATSAARLAEIERTARDIGRRIGVPVGRRAPRQRARSARAEPARTPAAHAVRAVQRARRPAIRGGRGRRVRQGVRRRCRAPARRAGQRVGQRCDHGAAGDPPRRAHPRPARRPGLAPRQGRQRDRRGADPRPRARDVAPRAPRRQRADAGAASASRRRSRRSRSSTSCTPGRRSSANRRRGRWPDG